MTSRELRQKYFDFFRRKGHALIPSASLIPEHDPTVLFTTAGMHPLTPYLLGEKHPAGRRLVNAQKCVRTADIESVGDTTHLTFFEMLGNWSLGDYFKKEAIAWSWEFLTDEKWLGIEPARLYITVYEGDELVPRDEESIKLWQEQFAKAGMKAEVWVARDTTPRIKYGAGSTPPRRGGDIRIFPLGRDDNWWGPAGRTGPCGPDTEMFFDAGRDKCGPDCKPGCACGKFVEIWNDVFMEYNKRPDGTYEPLKQKNVDTGMGVERTVAALNGLDSVFETDTLAPIMERIVTLERGSGATEAIGSRMDSIASLQNDNFVSTRIIADHIRASVMLAADGVLPSNVEQGYILRRLIRRAVRHGRQLGIKENFLAKLVPTVVDIYREVYPSVAEKQKEIAAAISGEEEKFGRTLAQGLEKFSQLVASEKTGDRIINGEDAFKLFATFGFPLEMTAELSREQGMSVDEKGFYAEFNKHQELSRTAAEQKFAGGLADHSEMSTKYHTATHLLHAALRQVLGKKVEQKGSNITSERLRFDFSHPNKMTIEETKQVEDLVNDAIVADYPVSCQEMSVAEAKSAGAIGLFEGKYGDKVKVYAIGAIKVPSPFKGEGGPPASQCEALRAGVRVEGGEHVISREICGGPHVDHTGVLGKFKITKEEAVAAGIRRIKAVLE